MRNKKLPMLDKNTLITASVVALKKLSLAQAAKNPVMFVVLVGAVVAGWITATNIFSGKNFAFELWTTLILLFTVLFANFAEAIAEERGRGQAASLRSARRDLLGRLLKGDKEEMINATQLRKGDRVRVSAGEYVPADGEIIRGVATINESALTGESAPVLREAGTDKSSVIGGTKMLTGDITVLIQTDPGDSFLDKMIGLVEGAERQKTPNELALTVLLAAMTLVFLIVVASLPPIAGFLGIHLDYTMLIALLVCLIPTTIGGLLPAIGIAGMNRALEANIIAKSGKSVEVAGDIDTLLLDKTGTITYGDRQATAFHPLPGINESELREAALLTSLADPTVEGKSIVKLAQAKGSSLVALPADTEIIPFSAETKTSGVLFQDGGQDRLHYIKGASDAVLAWGVSRGIYATDRLMTLVNEVARKGATPLCVANQDRLLGVVELSDVIKPGVAERFARLRKLGVHTLMVTGDNPITAGVIAAEAGVDDFVAEAKPEDKLNLIRDKQRYGRLVAMIGDGTNDAPALAQADVGIAMNSGTQAAKEASNMVDLDSDPTKLLVVVEIGKQLLITRGALTTFSLANDVAKYFAIIPAIFAAAFPAMAALDIMHLGSPQSGIMSALIFNALIIPALIPLALKGVELKPMSAEALLRNNMLIYGLGGILLPFVAIKIIDVILNVF